MSAKHVDALTERPVVSTQVSKQQHNVLPCVDKDESPEKH